MQSSFAAIDLHTETLGMIAQVIGPAETRELLQSLVASFEPAFAAMGAARKAGDFAALARAAHRLAGGCGSLGAQQMQEALRELEKAALMQAAETCDVGLARLPVLAANLRHAADEYAAADVMAG